MGLGGAPISGVVGVTLGLIADYYRGWLDDLIMRAVDVMMAIPTLLLALFILFILGGGFRIMILVLALLRWMIFAQLTRSMVLSLRETQFVTVARAVGFKNRRIIVRHLLANMFSAIAVSNASAIGQRSRRASMPSGEIAAGSPSMSPTPSHRSTASRASALMKAAVSVPATCSSD